MPLCTYNDVKISHANYQGTKLKTKSELLMSFLQLLGHLCKATIVEMLNGNGLLHNMCTCTMPTRSEVPSSHIPNYTYYSLYSARKRPMPLTGY